MLKKIKILLLRIKWVLFGGKPLKKVIREINEVNGIKEVKPIKRFRPSNGSYSSTKRCAIK